MAKLKNSVPESVDPKEAEVEALLAAIEEARQQAKKAYDYGPSSLYTHAAFVACSKVAKLAGC
jgi:hypothetical protein